MMYIGIFLAFLLMSPLSMHSDVASTDHSLDPILAVVSNVQGFIPVPFQQSLEWERAPTKPAFMNDSNIKIANENFANFCEKFMTTPVTDYSTPPLNYSIPPIIHFIWLGSSVPPRVQAAVSSWQTCHPGWDIRIWTDVELKNFSWSSPRSQFAFNEAQTWSEKSDVLRFEILYQFGGIYSDTDVVCLKPFHDLLINGVTFFACLEINYTSKICKYPLYVGSALLGAAKGSPVIKWCLDNHRTAKEDPKVWFTMRTGPGLVSRACRQALSSPEKDSILVLPCSYFFPLPHKREKVSSEGTLRYLSAESLAVHLWDGSWHDSVLSK